MANGSRRTSPTLPAAAAVVSDPIVAALYTPSSQFAASPTNGTVSLRLRLDPRNIVADGRHLPGVQTVRWNEHRKVGLAAGARKCCRDVSLASFRRRNAEDEHVLGEPAFVASHHRRNAQRETFLAQQCVAAVTRAIAPDLARFRKMHDVFVLRVARPCDVLFTFGQWSPDRVHAWYEHAIGSKHVINRASHASHQLHAGNDVWAVGQLHSDMRNRAAQRAHRKWNHIKRSAAHASFKKPLERLAHLRGGDPVVGRSGILFAVAADKCTILYTGHVRWVGSREITVRTLFRIEPHQRAGADHGGAQAVVFGLRAVAPDNV